MKKSINIVTLGCSKNVVDSEHIAGQLSRSGYRVVFEGDDDQAGVVVVNTCGFIGDAKQESVDTILHYARAREEGRIERLFVIGCLSERYRDELRDELPEVDEFFGARDLSQVIEALTLDRSEGRGQPPGPAAMHMERLLSTPSHYAYLKISEGCDRQCSFCAIPLIRGPHRSTPMEELFAEAETLAKQGVRELMVVAQDTTCYGVDLYGRRALADLLRGLCRIKGIEWVRLHYAYPAGFPRDVIEAMRDEPKICRYLDVPLQHIADSQLRAMSRSVDRKATEQLLSELRSEIPDIAIRTTLMTGFPGETQEDFAELVDFVRAARFERLGVFTYSEEEGTPAAALYRDDVPEEEKERRAGEIMRIQGEIVEGHNGRLVGRTVRVLIDGYENGLYCGRTEWDSPEVDQEVLVRSGRKLRAGEFYDVTVTEADSIGLHGVVG
ncbi:MAG: 30S ribosomal protein S12 methylthiotransferase RimO [Rikenellaceae bacterium]|nr:30S ribosomal protein S12 methylthiotransferase RimO [Rikenellaceae bacterium]